MSDRYVFPGIGSYVKANGLDPICVAKIPGIWFVSRVADALSQLTQVRPEDRAGVFAHARSQIECLRAALAVAEDAYADVLAHCPPLSPPVFAPAPALESLATPKPTTKGAKP